MGARKLATRYSAARANAMTPYCAYLASCASISCGGVVQVLCCCNPIHAAYVEGRGWVVGEADRYPGKVVHQGALQVHCRAPVGSSGAKAYVHATTFTISQHDGIPRGLCWRVDVLMDTHASFAAHRLCTCTVAMSVMHHNSSTGFHMVVVQTVNTTRLQHIYVIDLVFGVSAH